VQYFGAEKVANYGAIIANELSTRAYMSTDLVMFQDIDINIAENLWFRFQYAIDTYPSKFEK